MAEARVISVDIGSTWTKGALFLAADNGLRPAALAAAPTTPDDLARGFASVVGDLIGRSVGDTLEHLPPDVPVKFCSSAKGGLSIAAVGLVPDLTLRAARLTAMSAGGKVVASFSYRLAPDDLERLAELRPDIILLSGGTDGGNEEALVHNARSLAGAATSSVVLYAGNRSAAREVRDLLSGRELFVADNVMPAMGEFRPEPAREAIRRIFLDRIVAGKGLDRIVARTGHAPLPTPLAVYELAGAVRTGVPDFGGFCAVDLGGATTDVYSAADDPEETEAVITKGLPEPPLKRSVEGDLGLRISARTLREAAESLLNVEDPALRAFAESSAVHPERLAESAEDRQTERRLACELCLALSLMRHAGRLREVWIPTGRAYVREGKDLRHVKTLIGTGGYLARADLGIYEDARRLLPREDNGLILAPDRPRYAADRQYLWPLLGNLAASRPHAAACCALECLETAEHRPQNA